MQIKTATVVDIGTAMEANDDRVMVRTVIYDETAGVQEEQVPLLAVVCDGVGGYSGGGYAAELALTRLLHHDVVRFGEVEYLRCALNDINAEILRHKQTLRDGQDREQNQAEDRNRQHYFDIFHATSSELIVNKLRCVVSYTICSE